MPKYIDVDALLEEIKHAPVTMPVCMNVDECNGRFYERARLVRIIIEAPAADVRPVVLCRDCKHWFDIGADICSCDRDALLRHKDFFCAGGEMREVET